MTGLRRALVALGIAAVATGLLSLLLILTSDHLDDRGLEATFVLVVGWAFSGTGLFAWWRRPDNRVGPLMVAVGFGWLAQGLNGTNNSYVFALAFVLGSVAYAPLIHLIVSFPEGRLTDRIQRWAVGIVWLVVFGLQLVLVPFIDPPRLDGCEGCPTNPFLIVHSQSLINVMDVIQTVLGVVAITMVVVELRRRWRAATSAQRYVLAPVLWTGGITLVGIGLSISLDLAGVSQTVFRVVYLSSVTVLGSVPFAFLAGLLRSRFTRAGAVSDLVSRLGEGDARSRSLRDALADALGDPSLELAYWLPESERYVDAEGRPVELPAPGTGRAWTSVTRDGAPLAAIVHDESLAEDQDLVGAAGAAAALALENERLDAELRARVEELRHSRQRLIEVGLAERRSLERNLHDGAQQRLVALALNLRLARGKLEHDPDTAGDLLDEAMGELDEATSELRELARGIHPAVLSDRGLPAALEALAGRAPVPVEIVETPADSLPAPVEAVAYYVIAEALTNVARYAEADRAEVRVTRQNGRVVVQVSDNGVGGADPIEGSGLRGLVDRLAAFDGSLDVESPRGHGTTITARIPCG